MGGSTAGFVLAIARSCFWNEVQGMFFKCLEGHGGPLFAGRKALFVSSVPDPDMLPRHVPRRDLPEACPGFGLDKICFIA